MKNKGAGTFYNKQKQPITNLGSLSNFEPRIGLSYLCEFIIKPAWIKQIEIIIKEKSSRQIKVVQIDFSG